MLRTASLTSSLIRGIRAPRCPRNIGYAHPPLSLPVEMFTILSAKSLKPVKSFELTRTTPSGLSDPKIIFGLLKGHSSLRNRTASSELAPNFESYSFNLCFILLTLRSSCFCKRSLMSLHRMVASDCNSKQSSKEATGNMAAPGELL